LIKKIHFFIIGAAKSGTTALNDYLRQHPQICMASKKESHYFAFKDQLPIFNGPGDLKSENIINSKEQYFSLFNCNETTKLYGESSVFYLYYQHVAENIYKYNPKAKIIVLLRNPIDRAFSNYWYLKNKGREDSISFSEAIEKENHRKNNNWEPIWFYTELGLYYNQLLPYYQLFPSENILVLIYEDFRKYNKESLSMVCRFLHVSTNYSFEEVNPKISGIITNRTVNAFVKNALFRKSIKIFLSDTKWNILKKKYYRKPEIKEYEQKMLSDFYKKNNEKLSQLIQNDLSIWNEE